MAGVRLAAASQRYRSLTGMRVFGECWRAFARRNLGRPWGQRCWHPAWSRACHQRAGWVPARSSIFCRRAARAASGLSTAYSSSNCSRSVARLTSITRTSGTAPPW